MVCAETTTEFQRDNAGSLINWIEVFTIGLYARLSQHVCLHFIFSFYGWFDGSLKRIISSCNSSWLPLYSVINCTFIHLDMLNSFSLLIMWKISFYTILRMKININIVLLWVSKMNFNNFNQLWRRKDVGINGQDWVVNSESV